MASLGPQDEERRRGYMYVRRKGAENIDRCIGRVERLF
jgi:hypothetical protein